MRWLLADTTVNRLWQVEHLVFFDIESACFFHALDSLIARQDIAVGDQVASGTE